MQFTAVQLTVVRGCTVRTTVPLEQSGVHIMMCLFNENLIKNKTKIGKNMNEALNNVDFSNLYFF